MSSTAAPKLERLRQLLAEKKLDAYIIPTADAHQSEYVAECDQRRVFISGFTGSAGTALVTKNKALLWTDGRYWAQAGKELSSDWTLMKAGHPDVPKMSTWLAENLPGPSATGFDPYVFPAAQINTMEEDLADDQRLVPVEPNLVDQVWGSERPKLPATPLMVLSEQYTGASIASKLTKLRTKMQEAGAAALVVSTLDETAWLFNLRGSDVEFNPVFMSYALVTPSKATLYVDEGKVTAEVKAHLGDQVEVKDYNLIFTDLNQLSTELHTIKAAEQKDGKPPKLQNKVWMDPDKANVALFKAVPEQYVLEKASPIALLKAVKNAVELEGARQAHIRDGVAVVRFLSWLEQAIDSKEADSLDECSISDKLEGFRKEQKDFVGLSFPTIAGSGPNGAIIHYRPEKETCRKVTRDQMLLVDSGAQYKDGTTDITRTVHLGEPTAFEKAAFTRVLQGHIALAAAVFPPSATGPNLDVLARAPLWKMGLNYNHGTGHGVGAFLNVHEGPHGISATARSGSTLTTALEEGMLVTDEPGYYEDGKFGIRIESILAVQKAVTEHQFGGKPFLCFENLTMCPIQRKLIDLKLLSPEEVAWLDAYHATVRKTLSPFLSGADLEWLNKETEPLPKA